MKTGFEKPLAATESGVATTTLVPHRPEFLWSPTRIELITTKFMRNRLLFSTLANDILPCLRQEKKRPLRLLFWACSTGAEPYTLKYLLGPNSTDEIVGIDFDAGAIEQAQAGVYSPETWTMFFDGRKNLLTENEVSVLFEPALDQPNSFRITAPYRKNVSFLTGDLFAMEPAVAEKSFDLVVCNNLLLHLKPNSANHAWDYLHRYLDDDGLLLVAGCNPTVRAAAAKRLNLSPIPDQLTEISKNWAGVSGAWNFKERPAWAFPEPEITNPDYAFLAGEIFKKSSSNILPHKTSAAFSEKLPALRPKNIIITGSSFWNPGDDFVREGVLRVLRESYENAPLNLLFYNFNPDILPHVAQQTHSNTIAQGDLEKFRNQVDAIVIVGVSAGHELKPFYRWVLANNLADKVFLISGHYESAYAAEHIAQEPEASIFRHARILIGRTEKFPDFIRTAGLNYHHVNCPALLSVSEVKEIPAGKKIERIGFSIQLPATLGGIVNQACGETSYQLALEALYSLSKTHQVELVAHHKTEYFYFLELLKNTEIPVVFSSFYQDLFATYRRYDLVVTTRLHTSLFANGHGIPGIIINDTDRHTHTLSGFQHSPWVNTRAALEKALAHWLQADLVVVAKESAAFKTALISRYVQILKPAMNPSSPSPALPEITPLANSLDAKQRILFVRTDSIGDAVLASAMIEPLQRRYPQAQLAVLCQQHVAELFAACPFVHSVICYDRQAVEKNAEERHQILAEIAAFQPDVVLNSVRSRDKFSDDLTLAIDAAQHIAIEGDLNNITAADRDSAHEQYDLIVPTAAAACAELERHADFLQGIDVPAEKLQPTTWTTPAEDLLAEEFFKAQSLNPQKTLAIFPGAQHEVRVYRQYANALKNFPDFHFLIFGDASQTFLGEEIEKQLPGRTLNLCGRSTLRETIALLRRCRLYVGAESAGAHIACAVRVPNVVLLGGGHFGRFMPYSSLTSAVTLPLNCFGCNWRCQHQRTHCIKDISPELITTAIREALEKKATTPRIYIAAAGAWPSGSRLPLWKNPKGLLANSTAEIIEVQVAPPVAAISSIPVLPPPISKYERVACPACGDTKAKSVRTSADIVQCEQCETVYLRTRYTVAAMRQLYQSYANEGSHMALPKSSAEAENSGLKRDYFLQEILEHVQPSGGFLDVGCGWGAFLLNARNRGFQPRGIELTKACVNYANEHLKIPVVDSQLTETEIPAASLQVVTMNHVFEHLPEPKAALKKVIESLAPGGMFCGIVPNFASVCSQTLGEKWYWLDPNYHYQHFTPATMRRMLEAAGFMVEKIYTATGDYGTDAVRKACLATDVKLQEDDYFAAELKRYESEGRGEEIRFFARKPALPAKPSEQIILLPEIATGPEPIVSVVVSTYQSEKFMRACLENLTHQTIFDSLEIIVVDSGSPENERAIVAEFQQQFSNIRYVRTPRETLYAAWNRALSLARGRYFANVNTDDSLRNDALETLVNALEINFDCDLAYADCAWTTKPNDTYPSANIVRTVKYPDYAPVETLFYCITGCLQFFRAETLRKLGGFDAALKCAGDYEATLKLMAARKNAVHVPEVLSLFYQNTSGLTQASNRANQEHSEVMNRYRQTLNIENILQPCVSGNAKAWTALGRRAEHFSVPWEDRPQTHDDFAKTCYLRALELDPNSECAGMSLILLHHRLNQLTACMQELTTRWPKMKEWIDRLNAGESLPRLDMRHAVMGPVFSFEKEAARPTAEQLSAEPAALHPWIARIEGRHVYLSEDIFPRPLGLHFTAAELQTGANHLALLLKELPSFYAHFGGAGDLLLLLASFYDEQPNSVLFSYPNSVGATQALLAAFPKLSKIYFLPQHAEAYFHIVLRQLVYEVKNHLGAGTTPKFDYAEEWIAGLDIEKKYGVKLKPRWAQALKNNSSSKKIAIAPKGSLSGMVGSKRNIILPEMWSPILTHIIERGFEPVIIGVSNESKTYPALPGCTDVRAESFSNQMKIVGGCAGLVGADSWAKTFSALAQIPTIVFEPLKGADLSGWKDPSDWVFIEPWSSIKMIRSLDDFRREFDARVLNHSIPQRTAAPKVAWQGTFLDYGSLSHINRELTARLEKNLSVTRVGQNAIAHKLKNDAGLVSCAKKLAAVAPAETNITVRHQWPPDWSRPTSGELVVIQPWEFGSLPQAWLAAAANVDEFWVPTALVRQMYVDSGIDPEKVQVIPNGVDTQKYRPGLKPMKLATKKKFKFLFVGGTIYRKGPDILLDAFSQAFTSTDDVCLVVKDFGGDSCYAGQTAAEAIRALQNKPNAPEIIYLTQEMSAAEMPSLYAACDCLVLPYRGEGFGMPVLEAMACGLPVIVTAMGATDSFVMADAGWKIPARRQRLNGCVGEIPLVKSGWLLEPSTAALVRIMKTVAENPTECRRRGANGRSFVERRLDWNHVAAIVEHRLKTLASKFVDAETVANTVLKSVSVAVPDVARIGELKIARALLEGKNLEAAWETTCKALQKRPFHPAAFMLLAEIALAAGAAKAGKSCAEHAGKLAPAWDAPKKFLLRKLSGNEKPSWLRNLSELLATTSPRLSICLITKNEEKFLAQCLNSVRGLGAQIIIADTGSTDRTIEIANEYGAEVHSVKWTDDFAAARNAALAHATGDWVLMLDADEELPSEQHAKLLAHLKEANAIAFRLPLVNVGQENEGRSFVPRLFRNSPGVFFHGRIHEQVFASFLPNAKIWGLTTALGAAELKHHGYTKELIRDRNKVERNLKLLRLGLVENPQDINLLMNLGMELVRSDDLPNGLMKYREAFALMSAQPKVEVVPELREALLTQFTSQLYKVRGHEEVVRVLTSVLAKNGGLTASLHFALGLSLYELKNFVGAAEQMRQCLAKKNVSALTPINLDIHGSAPWHCRALSLARLGEKAEAEKCFAAAIASTGKVNEARVDFAKFLVEQNRNLEALQQLHPAVAIDPQCLTAWRLGGQIALARNEYLEFAQDWTCEALKVFPEDVVIQGLRAEAFLLAGKMNEALILWRSVREKDNLPRSHAAVILCSVHAGEKMSALGSTAEEEQLSRVFIGWYQRLIGAGAPIAVAKVNSELDKLAVILPTAARMLRTAFAEAAAENSAP